MASSVLLCPPAVLSVGTLSDELALCSRWMCGWAECSYSHHSSSLHHGARTLDILPSRLIDCHNIAHSTIWLIVSIRRTLQYTRCCIQDDLSCYGTCELSSSWGRGQRAGTVWAVSRGLSQENNISSVLSNYEDKRPAFTPDYSLSLSPPAENKTHPDSGNNLTRLLTNFKLG